MKCLTSYIPVMSGCLSECPQWLFHTAIWRYPWDRYQLLLTDKNIEIRKRLIGLIGYYENKFVDKMHLIMFVW